MEQVAGVPYRNKRITCPHCGEDFAVTVSWELSPSRVIPKNGDHTATSSRDFWLSTIDPGTKEIIESFKNTGIVSAFEKAYAAARGVRPKIAEKGLLAWCRTAVPKPIPPSISTLLMREYGHQRSIRIVAGNEVAGILVDDVLVEIIPFVYITGDNVKGIAGVIRPTVTDTIKMEEWIRTKYGYVGASGPMLTELRRKCIGDFDKPGVTSR